MNKAFRILLAVLLVQLSLQASAQEKKDLFNPVNYAVVSQTIAPDARGGGLPGQHGVLLCGQLD